LERSASLHPLETGGVLQGYPLFLDKAIDGIRRVRYVDLFISIDENFHDEKFIKGNKTFIFLRGESV